MTQRKSPTEIATMAELRTHIDAVDRELVALLARRERLTDRAPALKPAEGIAARAPRRINEVLDNVRQEAMRQGLDPALAERIWRDMIETVIAREEREIGTGGRDG